MSLDPKKPVLEEKLKMELDRFRQKEPTHRDSVSRGSGYPGEGELHGLLVDFWMICRLLGVFASICLHCPKILRGTPAAHPKSSILPSQGWVPEDTGLIGPPKVTLKVRGKAPTLDGKLEVQSLPSGPSHLPLMCT